MLRILCGILMVGGYITVFSSVMSFIIALFGKDKKSSIKGPVIAFAVGILIVLLASLILRFSL